jgi:hypothetical protein
MDPRIGGPLPWEHGCGYITPTHVVCGKQPVVRHFLFNEEEGDGYRPTGLTCENHIKVIPTSIVYMWHPVTVFCTMEGSCWSLPLNTCVMPTEDYEKALLGEVDFGKELLAEMEKLDEQQRTTN